MGAVIQPRQHLGQPMGLTDLDYSHQLFRGGKPLLSVLPTGFDSEGIESLSVVGTVIKTADTKGMAWGFDNSASYLRVGRNFSPSGFALTAVFCVRNKLSTQYERIFKSSVESSYCGAWVNITNTGAVDIGFGNGSAPSASSRASLTTANGIVGLGNVTIVIVVTSRTTGFCFINGVRFSMTPSGTATTYTKGGGAYGAIGATLEGSSWGYSSINVSHLTIVDYASDEKTALDLSLNPWQIFKVD